MTHHIMLRIVNHAVRPSEVARHDLRAWLLGTPVYMDKILHPPVKGVQQAVCKLSVPLCIWITLDINNPRVVGRVCRQAQY